MAASPIEWAESIKPSTMMEGLENRQMKEVQVEVVVELVITGLCCGCCGTASTRLGLNCGATGLAAGATGAVGATGATAATGAPCDAGATVAATWGELV